MALNTYMTYLLSSSTKTGTYSIVCPIKDTPDMGGDVNQLDSTTLSDDGYTYIAGIKQTAQTLEFTANYDPAIFEQLDGDNSVQWYKLALGKSESGGSTTYGKDGYFLFSGEVNVKLSGKGVDEVREMVIQITPNTVPEYNLDN